MRFLSARNIRPYDFIKALEVDFNLAELYAEHTAADVNTDYIRNNHLTEVSGKADSTALSRVNVGHNSYFCIPGEFLGAKKFNLFYSGVIHRFGKNLCSSKGAFYF